MEKFHKTLDALEDDLLEMGHWALAMLQKSIKAVIDVDMDLANEILDMKSKLMEDDARIEEEALRLLTLYQPMARDVRTIACILKNITYLTRIGRYGKDIANIVKKEMQGKQHIKKIVSLQQMTKIVEGMIEDALYAFRKSTIDPIQDLESRDDEVDELRISIFRECLTYMMENPKNIPICTAYIMIARYLERCGDHACKMGEKIHYMVTGEHIEIS